MALLNVNEAVLPRAVVPEPDAGEGVHFGTANATGMNCPPLLAPVTWAVKVTD